MLIKHKHNIVKLSTMKYYLNKNAQPTGEHEIHKLGCEFMPDIGNRIYLGDFSNCYEAKVEALKYYLNVDGCFYCNNECHSR